MFDVLGKTYHHNFFGGFFPSHQHGSEIHATLHCKLKTNKKLVIRVRIPQGLGILYWKLCSNWWLWYCSEATVLFKGMGIAPSYNCIIEMVMVNWKNTDLRWSKILFPSKYSLGIELLIVVKPIHLKPRKYSKTDMGLTRKLLVLIYRHSSIT